MSPVTIDGKFDDWNDVASFRLNKDQQVYFTKVSMLTDPGTRAPTSSRRRGPTPLTAPGRARTRGGATAYVKVLVEKSNGEPWTSEDHLLLAFDSNPATGTRMLDMAPGVRFNRPVEYVLRCVLSHQPMPSPFITCDESRPSHPSLSAHARSRWRDGRPRAVQAAQRHRPRLHAVHGQHLYTHLCQHSPGSRSALGERGIGGRGGRAT